MNSVVVILLSIVSLESRNAVVLCKLPFYLILYLKQAHCQASLLILKGTFQLNVALYEPYEYVC